MLKNGEVREYLAIFIYLIKMHKMENANCYITNNSIFIYLLL